MDKIFKDKKFIEILTTFLPANYHKLNIEQRENLIFEFEKYAAKLQGRDELNLKFYNFGPTTKGEYHDNTKEILISQNITKNNLKFYNIFELIFHEGTHHKQHNLEKYGKYFTVLEKEQFKINNNSSLFGYLTSKKHTHDIYYFQPIEYNAYKEGYIYTKMLLEFIQNNIDKKHNYIKEFDKDVRGNGLYFEDEVLFKNKIIPIQQEILRYIENRKLVYKTSRSLFKRVHIDTASSLKTDELIALFMDDADFGLRTVIKKDLINELVSRLYNEYVKLSASELDKSIDKYDGFNLLNEILKISSDKVLNQKNNTSNLDYVYSFMEGIKLYYKDYKFSFNNAKDLNLNMKYFMHQALTSIDSRLNTYFEGGILYTLNPKFDQIQEEYVNKMLFCIMTLEKHYGEDVVNSYLNIKDNKEFLKGVSKKDFLKDFPKKYIEDYNNFLTNEFVKKGGR